MPQSVWPYDVICDPTVEPRPSPYESECFVLLRSEPKDSFDDLMAIIRKVCERLGGYAQLKAESAMDIISSGVIHHEIWTRIKRADIVIADVTGYNPNVVYELGVAAASKDKRRVVFLREDTEETQEFPFDQMPVRHLVYRRSLRGYSKLSEELFYCLQKALAAAPFETVLGQEAPLPLKADLTDGKDSPFLWSPDLGHRRLLPEPPCLEFGSFRHFPSSWLSAGGLILGDVQVSAEMRFTALDPGEEVKWLGIALRSQGYHVDFNYLVHLTQDGKVNLSVPNPDRDPPNVVETFGQVTNMGNTADGFISFHVAMNDQALTLSVGPVRARKPLVDMPHVYSRGRVLLQTAYCRAGLRNLIVDGVRVVDDEARILPCQPVEAAGTEDIWAKYDPERVRQALRKSCGALAGVDREALLSDVHEQREQASLGRPG